jgi:hypothetical protein
MRVIRQIREPVAVTQMAEDLHLSTVPVLEGKAPVFRKADKTSKLQDVRASINPKFKSQVARTHKQSKKEFDQSIKKLHLELGRLMASEMAGRIRTDFAGFRKRVKDRLAKAHTQAFTQGRMAAGLSRGEANLKKDPVAQARLNSIVKEELGYLDKFLDRVEVGDWSGGFPSRRIARYVNSVAGSFTAGRAMAMPSMTIFHWHLESGDPCDDCILIAKHSPYTRESLPAVPRSGQTRCRNYCYCTLEAEVADEKKINKVRRKHITRSALLKKIKKQQPKPKRKRKKVA